MSCQNLGSSNWDNFGTPPSEFQEKYHWDVGATKEHREYYMGEGGGFPQVRVMVSLVSPKLLVVRPNTKGVLENELTNLWLVGCRSK
jgi:hypothetical protein